MRQACSSGASSVATNDSVINVASYISYRCHFRPWDLGVVGLHVSGQIPACLRDDFQTSLDQPLFLPVVFETIERSITHDRAHARYRFNDIG
jgi:hypothetical protein